MPYRDRKMCCFGLGERSKKSTFAKYVDKTANQFEMNKFIYSDY